MAPTYEESVAAGRNAIAARKSEFHSWTFVYDGYFRRAGSEHKDDAYIVEVDDATMQAPLKVLQAYQPFATGTFKLKGPPEFRLSDAPTDPELTARLGPAAARSIRR